MEDLLLWMLDLVCSRAVFCPFAVMDIKDNNTYYNKLNNKEIRTSRSITHSLIHGVISSILANLEGTRNDAAPN